MLNIQSVKTTQTSKMHFIDAPAKFVLVIGAVLGVILFNLPLPTVKELTGEGDLVENLSSVVLGLVVVLTAIQAARTRSSGWLSATVMALWMFLRELDFQRRFTPRSVESIGFYTRGTIPLQMKLVVLAILAPFFHTAYIRRPVTIRGSDSGWYPSVGIGTLVLFDDLLRVDVARGLRDGRWTFSVDVTRDLWGIL